MLSFCVWFFVSRIWAYAARDVITLSITHSYDIPCFNRGSPELTTSRGLTAEIKKNFSLNQVLTDLFVVHGNGLGRDDPSRRCSVFFTSQTVLLFKKNCSVGSLLFHSSVWPRLKCKAQNAKSHLMLAQLVVLNRTNAMYICKRLSNVSLLSSVVTENK